MLLKALGVTGLTPIANAIGHDHTYVSRWRSGTQGMNMRDLLTTLEKCGLQLVRAEPNMVSIDKERYAALVTMANLGQRQINEELKEIMGRSE